MSNTYKVVLVDDEPIILRSLKVALPWDEMDMEIVGEASNGEEGLKRIAALRPDIVISDIRMPVLDGIAMMREALQLEHQLIFVLLSGYGEFEYAREALRSGAFDYLLKPVDHEELETVMREARHKLEQEAQSRSERDYLTRSAQALSSLVRERLVSTMLEGSDKPFAPTYWLNGWDLEHPYVMLVAALDDTPEARNWSREDRKLWFFAVGNVLAEFGEACGAFTVFPFRSGEWVLLLQNRSEAEAGRTAEELIRLVKSCTKLSCSVGISREHLGLEALFACYRSAQQALIGRYSGGIERVYAAGSSMAAACRMPGEGNGQAELALEASGPGIGMSRSLEKIDWERQLSEALAGFDKGEAAAVLERLTAELWSSGRHPDETAASLIELTVGVSRRAADLLGEPLPRLPELISRLPHAGGPGEAELLLKQALCDYIDRMAEGASRDDELRSIVKAKEYIAGRFHHDLSIDEVSEFAGLSCSHFCVLFKKESGVTFLEYLTKLRMDRACSILRNTDVKVYQVAPLVGYQDPKYFTQVFKKLMGMTPSEYRTAAMSGTV